MSIQTDRTNRPDTSRPHTSRPDTSQPDIKHRAAYRLGRGLRLRPGFRVPRWLLAAGAAVAVAAVAAAAVALVLGAAVGIAESRRPG